MKFIKYFFLFLLSTQAVHYKAQINNSKSNNQSTLVFGNARFTILTSQLIRIEWSENGKFEDLASLVFINRNLPTPQFKQNKKGKWRSIETDKLKLFYKIQSGKFTKENLYIIFDVNGKQMKWFPGQIDSLNLKGTTRTLDNTDGKNNIQLEDGILSKNGWYLHDDSKTNLFDSTNWIIERDSTNKQDWYFFGYGHEYKKALLDYTSVAGKIPMPPRFAFGYWWSRYWTYSDLELRNLINDIHLHKMPLDVLVIDMDWHETFGLSLTNPKRDEFGELIGWTGYTWNKQLFPEPEKFLNWTKKNNLKTALNLHPASGIYALEDSYSTFSKKYNFDTTFHQNIPMKIEEKKWVDIYTKNVLHPLEKQGVDFWWLDWQQWIENKNVKNLSNTWWLNHIFFTDMEKEGVNRPMLFHRWGGMGNHRYQIGFSGDTHSTWESLAYQPYFTSTASNVGYGYWSHDIGGHMGDDADPELYLRWIQFGTFSPILRTHCTKSKDIERRMFMYPKEYSMMLDALQMRYSLNPYIYNASRNAYETGISICHPMYYDFPENQLSYDYSSQYMFGNDLIISPVTSKSENDLSIKKIWLPEGEWYEFSSGSLLDGNNEYVRNYHLSEIPVFVKAGTIIPMYPKTIQNLQIISDTLILHFIPGGNSSLKIYEDDGTSSDYTHNQTAFTIINKEVIANNEIHIKINPTEGIYVGMKSEIYYSLEFPSMFPPEKVNVGGIEYLFSEEAEIGFWSYDAEKLCVQINLPKMNRKELISISILPTEKTKGHESLLNGKIGVISRTPFIIEKLKYALNTVDPFANLTNNILKLGSLSSTIQYDPQSTLKTLLNFNNDYQQIISDINSYTKINKTELNEILKLLENDITILPNPMIQIEKLISEDPVKVCIYSQITDAEIYYTLDSSIPTEKSNIYTGEFTIGRTCEIKARCFQGVNAQSQIASMNFKRIISNSLQFQHQYSQKYNGGNPLAIVDGNLGSEKKLTEKWIGFEGDDMLVTIKLSKTMDIKTISTRFLESNSSWIFAPTELIFEVSQDGINFKKVYYQDLKAESQENEKGSKIIQVSHSCNEIACNYIRVTAKNRGICPTWHSAAGGKAWLFVDEILVE